MLEGLVVFESSIERSFTLSPSHHHFKNLESNEHKGNKEEEEHKNSTTLHPLRPLTVLLQTLDWILHCHCDAWPCR